MINLTREDINKLFHACGLLLSEHGPDHVQIAVNGMIPRIEAAGGMKPSKLEELVPIMEKFLAHLELPPVSPTVHPNETMEAKVQRLENELAAEKLNSEGYRIKLEQLMIVRSINH